MRLRSTAPRPVTPPWLARLVLGVALLLAALPAQAQIGSERYASIVIEARSGAVLSAANAEELRHPASLTKMMTLYMAFEAMRQGRVRANDLISVSAAAAAEPPSKLGLRPGSQLTVQQAVMALITKSANDAATALGEHLGGSEARFAHMMTQRARQLGMPDTVFRNAHGLPDRAQVTTARDMATLGRRLYLDFPNEYRLFSAANFAYRGRTHYNHNRLLASYEGADGIKTGYINDSGFNLVASAERDGVRLVAVVFGGASGRERDAHISALMDRGFSRMDVREANRTLPTPSLVSRAYAATTRPAQPPARATRTAPLARPAVAQARGWGVQVGAFTDRAGAQRAASQAARGLGPGAKPVVRAAQQRRGTIYRAQVGNLTQAQAQGACASLARRKAPCMTLRPSDAPEIAAASR
jgi:D-alanyl-D-alanine carboxypeptidase